MPRARLLVGRSGGAREGYGAGRVAATGGVTAHGRVTQSGDFNEAARVSPWCYTTAAATRALRAQLRRVTEATARITMVLPDRGSGTCSPSAPPPRARRPAPATHRRSAPATHRRSAPATHRRSAHAIGARRGVVEGHLIGR